MTRAPEPRIRRHVSAGLLAVAVMAMLAPGAAGLAAPPTRAVPVRSVPVRAVPARLAVAATGSSRATLRVVGLGDSVPSGGACGCTPYVQLAARRIGALQGRPVSVVNWASADDTHRLLRTVSSPAVRRQLAPSELVIVQAGANDFSAARISACSDRIERCYGPQIRAMRRRLSTALSRIYHLQRNARAEVVAVGYWNVFRDGAVGRSLGPAYVRGSDRLTRRVNAPSRWRRTPRAPATSTATARSREPGRATAPRCSPPTATTPTPPGTRCWPAPSSPSWGGSPAGCREATQGRRPLEFYRAEAGAGATPRVSAWLT